MKNKPMFHADPLTRIRNLVEENTNLKAEVTRLKKVGKEYQEIVNRLTEQIWKLEGESQ